MFIPLIPPPSSEFAMNYFIVRNDDDLFVFRKKNCFWNKKFPKKHKKLFRFLCAGVLLACCFEGIVCLRCCCGKHNFKRLNSHYTIFSEYNWKLNLFRFMLLSGYRLNKQIELRAIIYLPLEWKYHDNTWLQPNMKYEVAFWKLNYNFLFILWI